MDPWTLFFWWFNTVVLLLLCIAFMAVAIGAWRKKRKERWQNTVMAVLIVIACVGHFNLFP